MGDPRNRPEWELREEEEKLFKKSDTPLETTVTTVVLIGFLICLFGWFAWVLIWPFVLLCLSILGGFLVGI